MRLVAFAREAHEYLSEPTSEAQTIEEEVEDAAADDADAADADAGSNPWASSASSETRRRSADAPAVPPAVSLRSSSVDASDARANARAAAAHARRASFASGCGARGGGGARGGTRLAAGEVNAVGRPRAAPSLGATSAAGGGCRVGASPRGGDSRRIRRPRRRAPRARAFKTPRVRTLAASRHVSRRRARRGGRSTRRRPARRAQTGRRARDASRPPPRVAAARIAAGRRRRLATRLFGVANVDWRRARSTDARGSRRRGADGGRSANQPAGDDAAPTRRTTKSTCAWRAWTAAVKPGIDASRARSAARRG